MALNLSLLKKTILISFWANPLLAGVDIGRIIAYSGQYSATIAAPHGSWDLNTKAIAQDTCKTISWNCVLAEGFRTMAEQFNVNRPTQGANRSKHEESHTYTAQMIYRQFEQSIRSVDPRPILYVELHGNSKQGKESIIEIANVGLSFDQVLTIKEIFNDKLYESGLEDYEVLVEGVDPIYYRASACKEWGTLSHFSPSLHIELPRQLRSGRKSQALVQFLAASLPEILTILPSRFHD